MDEIIPWNHWVKQIAPYYPSGKRGRPPRGIETMLRTVLMQIWFNLSDVGIEDATILSAPSSAKNQEKKRDPEMYQAKKGTSWRFGMKIHADVDTESGYVHKITATSANIHNARTRVRPASRHRAHTKESTGIGKSKAGCVRPIST